MGELLAIPSTGDKNIIWLILGVLIGSLGVIINGFIIDDKNTKILGIIFLVLSLAFGIGWILAIIWTIVVFIKNL
jgi:LPXTG-motif cell wall-anchored protein